MLISIQIFSFIFGKVCYAAAFIVAECKTKIFHVGHGGDHSRPQPTCSYSNSRQRVLEVCTSLSFVVFPFRWLFLFVLQVPQPWSIQWVIANYFKLLVTENKCSDLKLSLLEWIYWKLGRWLHIFSQLQHLNVLCIDTCLDPTPKMLHITSFWAQRPCVLLPLPRSWTYLSPMAGVSLGLLLISQRLSSAYHFLVLRIRRIRRMYNFE